MPRVPTRAAPSLEERARRRDAREERMKLVSHLREFVRNDEGQDLLEYALLVALIALVCVVTNTSTGQQVNIVFQKIMDAMVTANA
jgi:Flp pilus assembly pilin Flp